ncbi:hypothetical protein GUH47_18145 [Xanthomonas citri pv. citri]|nr:hypothetical protein ART_00110 [Achromobacter phage vB_Ade_ART]MBD4207875.1 hypothetical protein [Xanthomonas citri pv. citri]
MPWLLIKNFLGKWWPYIVIAILVVIGLFLVYNAGYNKARTAGELKLSALLLAQSEEAAKKAAEARGKELAHAAEVAKIEQEGVRNAEQIRKVSQKTIDDLNSGSVRLRKRLAAYENGNDMSGSTTSSGVDSRGSVETIGLRLSDATFLVRGADGADLARNALKTCVEIAQRDRAMLMDWYKANSTTP